MIPKPRLRYRPGPRRFRFFVGGAHYALFDDTLTTALARAARGYRQGLVIRVEMI